MAKRKKPKLTKKARINALHRQNFLDRLPGNEKERLELMLKFTERAMDNQDDGTMARQGERIKEKIKNLQ
jgi:hypothetical protein